jgi:protein TonB
MSIQEFFAIGRWRNGEKSDGRGELDIKDSGLLGRTRLKRFLLLSLAIHLAVIIAQGLVPVKPVVTKPLKPIHVKYVEPKKPEAARPRGTLVDIPEPKKTETPRSANLLSSFDSRAHSNMKKSRGKEYRRHRTVVPKAGGQSGNASQTRPKTEKPIAKPKAPQAPKKSAIALPVTEQGTRPLSDTQEVEETQTPETSRGKGGAMALLDGFDADKYASIDTQTKNMEESDDDEAISLDTAETKYASYFARIKHQIERVWIYPSEAARRGIKGELTLKFKISKDGNLMSVRLIDASGHEILDEAALKAVKEAAPYYPFPVTIKKENLSIVATFVYSPAYGLLYP